MLKPQCVSTSLRLRLYSPGEWIHKAVSLRETQGDTDRYKEMKREKKRTEIEKDAHREKEVCFPGLKNLTETKPKRAKSVFLI